MINQPQPSPNKEQCPCCTVSFDSEDFSLCYAVDGCRRMLCKDCYIESEECCKCCFESDAKAHSAETCMHCVQCKKERVEVVMRAWFHNVRKFNNSMWTTKNVHFKEGNAQLKWWRVRGRLIVKTVALLDYYRGRGLFTQACRNLLASLSEVSMIQLESVQEEGGLIEKLQKMGWEREPNSNNLFLEKIKTN